MKSFSLIALVFLMTPPALADLKKMPAMIYCGPTKEVEATGLHGFTKTAQGFTGRVKGGDFSEIWENKSTDEYYIVQRIDGEGLSCVVLGGSGLKAFISGTDT